MRVNTKISLSHVLHVIISSVSSVIDSLLKNENYKIAEKGIIEEGTSCLNSTSLSVDSCRHHHTPFPKYHDKINVLVHAVQIQCF